MRGRFVPALVFAVYAAAGLTWVAAVASNPPKPPPKKRPSPSQRIPPELRRLMPFRVTYRELLGDHVQLVRKILIHYTANGGRRRIAYVVLPRWYNPRKHPPLPLVISPHGRGVPARDALNYWGGLCAFGPFALVVPEGQGRKLILESWGWRGQIDDLARMPDIVERELPWLRIDRERIFAIGSSMGGQETLMLVARHPRLLAGAAALDSAVDMVNRYHNLAEIKNGTAIQKLARIEIGGTPEQVPRAYALRSPITYAREIAFSGVPLQMWWSTQDQIVLDQNDESGRLYRQILRLNPHASLTKSVGTWAHSREFYPLARLPLVLVRLELIRLDAPLPKGVRP